MGDNDDEVDERTVQEEYKVWKKNVPYLYDVLLTHGLDWPSLTAQWLPDRHVAAGNDYAEHKLILGTHTSGDEPNYLMIAKVVLPTDETVLDARKYDEERGELGGYGGSSAKVEVLVKIVHDREVNKARYCPQNPFLIATKSPSADVLVFDYSKHPNKPADASVCKPNFRLKGHEQEGYGLAWSPFEPGKLVSAGDDKLVCMWDLGAGAAPGAAAGAGSASSAAASSSSSSSAAAGGTVIHAHRTLRGHSEVVEDVAWHRHSKDIVGSCGDDKMLYIWDLRDGGGSGAPKQRVQAHDGDVMGLSFNPYQQHLLVTAGTDHAVKLWDTRALKEAVHLFEGHVDDATGVAWSPFNETVFASSGADRRVLVWDCSRIGMEQSDEDAEDGPPELLFSHGGHTSKVSDFSWSETEEWVLASVAEDNVLQVWAMAEDIYAGGGSDGEEDEGEEEESAAAAAPAGAGSRGGARAKPAKGGKAAAAARDDDAAVGPKPSKRRKGEDDLE